MPCREKKTTLEFKKKEKEIETTYSESLEIFLIFKFKSRPI